jgi:hypothetical protein
MAGVMLTSLKSLGEKKISGVTGKN